jgi:hypothetical protein
MSEDGQAAPVDGQAAPTEVTGNWFDGLHADFKADPSVETFTKTDDGLNKFVESHLNLRKKMGTAVWIPQEGAKPEDVADFRTKLGIPQTPEKYEIKYKEHEALQYDENSDKAYKTLAHKIGLTPKQAQELADFDADRFINAHTTSTKAYEDASNAYREETGNDFQVNLDRANNLIRTYADDKDKEAIAKYGNDLTLVRLFNKIALDMSEHHFVSPDKGNNISGDRQVLEDQAKEMIIKMQDKKTGDAEKKMLDRKVHDIYTNIYGTEEVSGSGKLNIR